jgi:CIC family chloride channel protein
MVSEAELKDVSNAQSLHPFGRIAFYIANMNRTTKPPRPRASERILTRLLRRLEALGPWGQRSAYAIRSVLVQTRRQTRRVTFGPRRTALSGWDDLIDWVSTKAVSENALLLVFAVIIGIGAALGIVVFYKLIDASYWLFVALPGENVEALKNPLYRPVLTALGFMAAVAVMRRFAPGEDGINVPDLKRRVAQDGGHMPMKPLGARSLASAITLGAGGSVGSEGPAAVVGGGLGSYLSRVFRFSRERTRLLVSAGTAAGISAAFNAPLAGAFFALEELLGGLHVRAFPTVVVSSVHPAFPIPVLHPSRSWFELLALPPLLGVACGLVTVLFVRSYFGIGKAMRERVKSPGLRAAIGGGAVGLLVYASGGLLLGPGHLSIPAEVFSGTAWWIVLALVFAKIIATSLTLGSGGSGGLFAPALYVGAATGSALAGALAWAMPSLQITPAAWAFVAMGGVVGAATGAPITAVLLVFELTDDYALMPPLLLVTGLALVIARRYEKDDLYSGWLRRRGIVLRHENERDVLSRLHVRDACDMAPLVVREHERVETVLARVAFAAQPMFPVVDANGKLAGILPVGALASASRQTEALPMLLVADLAVSTPAVTLDTPLDDVMRRMGARDLAALPVVAVPSGQLLGLITRAHLTRVVERAMLLERPATAPMPAGVPHEVPYELPSGTHQR